MADRERAAGEPYQELAWPYDTAGLAQAGLQALEAALAGAPAAGAALELGCGAGHALIALERRGWRALGIDRSPAMLALAEGRLRDQRSAARAIAGDLSDAALRGHRDLAPGSFDLALCLGDTLAELLGPHELVRALQLAGAALRPGGRLAFDLRGAEALGRWDARDEVLHDAGGLLLYARRGYNPRTRLATSRYVWMAREDTRWWRGEALLTTRCWAAEELELALERAGLRLARVDDLGDGRALYLAEA